MSWIFKRLKAKHKSKEKILIYLMSSKFENILIEKILLKKMRKQATNNLSKNSNKPIQ